jgi:hypothetical protein
LRFQREKHQFDTATVMYQQTRFGLPVWHGGVAIHMKTHPYRIISSQSTRHADLDDLKKPSKVALTRLKKLNKVALAKALNLARRIKDVDTKTLAARVQLVIYRFKAERREMLEEPPSRKFGHKHPTISLQPVPKSIKQDKH